MGVIVLYFSPMPTTTTHCDAPGVDHHEDDDEGGERPIVCAHCARPAHYDYDVEDYVHCVHCVDPHVGCFLIPARDVDNA